jgi:hypothetical protein
MAGRLKEDTFIFQEQDQFCSSTCDPERNRLRQRQA